jgi:hypothetical protein
LCTVLLSLVALAIWFPDPFFDDLDSPTLIGGGLAYAFRFAMAATSGCGVAEVRCAALARPPYGRLVFDLADLRVQLLLARVGIRRSGSVRDDTRDGAAAPDCAPGSQGPRVGLKAGLLDKGRRFADASMPSGVWRRWIASGTQ